jgi:hypothetical protein
MGLRQKPSETTHFIRRDEIRARWLGNLCNITCFRLRFPLTPPDAPNSKAEQHRTRHLRFRILHLKRRRCPRSESMSFWSRSKKKEEKTTPSASPSLDKSEKIAPSSFPVPPSTAPEPTPEPQRAEKSAASPWSVRKFRNANPFPRYGHAANGAAGKEAEVYVFGGLVKDRRRNDLFVIDSGSPSATMLTAASMTSYNISAAGDGPSPRLGHAAILVGNAFIGIPSPAPLTRSFRRRMCHHRTIP